VPAPLSDYAYTRALGWRRRAAGGRVALVALLVVALLVLGYGGYRGARFAWHRLHTQETASSHPVTHGQLRQLTQVTPNTTDQPAAVATDSPTPSPPPPTGALLAIPYTVQAPFANWKFHQESCEEAAVLMYHDFLQGDTRTNIPPAEADQQLRALKAWQVQNWGSEKDLTIDRTGQLAQAYFGFHYQVIQVTEDSIRQAIAAGHPVVIPVMTHSLQNPHYGPRTVYHELLIKGYSGAGVVSNDAGVQEGKDWFYSWSILFGAIDAQTSKMSQGRVGLILTR
jgi:Peptidase_C39 like family